MSAGFFPRFVLRLAGGAIDAVDAQRTGETDALVERIARLEAELVAGRDALSERLHEWIGGSDDDEERARVLAARRDLFNLRGLRRPVGELAFLPPPLFAEVERAAGRCAELAATRRSVAEAFRREAAGARRALQGALDDDDFQRGLLLSSGTLYGAQRFYRRADPARLRAKERRVERGLLRYWSRMVSKATPFGTFCRVLEGALGRPAGAGPALAVEGVLEEGRVEARLNKAHAHVLSARVMREPELRRRLDVELNPTLRLETDEPEGAGGERLAFLGVTGIRETFQRLALSPPLAWLRQYFAERSAAAGGGRDLPTLDELARAFAEASGAGSADEVAPFLDRLVELGLLRLTWSVPAQELDWERKMADRLAATDLPASREAGAFLAAQRDDVERYAAAADGEERFEIYRRLERRIEEYVERHGLQMRVNTPVFEDATAAARAVLDDGEDLTAIEASLVRYVDLTARLSLLRADMAAMRHFHDRRFGERPVPLLEFYEIFFREHYRRHLEEEYRSRRGERTSDGYDLDNPFSLDLVERIRAAHQELATLVGERWEGGGDDEDGEEIHLTFDELEAVCGTVEPAGAAADGWSVTVYAEPIGPRSAGEPGRLHVRRGGYFVGFGKLFSRFLPLFDDRFTEELRERNRQVGEGALLAELAEDANFNANLHPWLVEHEIRDPLSEGRGRGDAFLPTDLVVRPHPHDPHALELAEAATGRRVLPIDTGFMSPGARPPLHRLLVNFHFTPTFNWPLPSRRGDRDLDEVTVRPRVVLDERLVLYRRTWLVPGERYPRRRDGESEAEYFLRLGLWRRRHGLPERVYLKFQLLRPTAAAEGAEETADTAETAETAEAAGAAPTAELRKPQLVDFTHPLFALLVGHAAPDDDAFVASFEECLPDRDALAQTPAGSRVGELVLQLDRLPDGADGADGADGLR